jgi:hypothetical protein
VRRAVLATLVAFTAAACSSSATARCSTEGMDPQPELTCEVAIGAVRERLALVSGVEDFEIRYGGFCPPDVDCRGLSDRTSARVYVDMESGEELAMRVTLQADGSVQVTAPERVPGPTTVP